MKLSATAVALVNNPTQLLFAIEAADALAHVVQDLHVLTVPTAGARADRLYENLLSAAGIRDITKLGPESLSRTNRMLDVYRFRHTIDPKARIITPMINYLPARSLINRAGPNAVITDDGTWNLHFAEMRRTEANPHRTPWHALIPFTRLPRALNFFSIYDEMSPGKLDTVTPNELTWAKKNFFQGRQGDHLVLLGSDLARSGYITTDSMTRHVARIREAYPLATEYWPHRREDYDVAQSLCQRFDMTLRERELPLEAEILASQPSPAIVATLPSTATRTLRILKDTVGYKIVVTLPHRNEIAASHAELYESIVHSAMSDSDEIL